MGLLDFLRPSPEKRLAKAKRHAESGHWADARDMLEGLELPEAVQLRRHCQEELVRLNLEAARTWSDAGDEDRVQIHLELADELHPGGMEDEFRETRRYLREGRAERKALEDQRKRETDARLMQVDPLGFTGSKSMADPIPDDLLGEDAEEERVRLALLVENYPKDLVGAVSELGPEFARAVLDLDDGRPDLAVPTLMTLPDDQPLVRWERARSAYAMGDPAAAAREVRAFVELTGHHHIMGQLHSGLFLAQMLAETGDLHAALRVLRDVRATEPKLGGFMMAQLLHLTGEDEQAEKVLRSVILQQPKNMGAYKLLAQVRVKGGYRIEAMQALEKALSTSVCGSPGKCGFVPPDPEIQKLLATLYLEDGIEKVRALELFDAIRHEAPRTWEDLYLHALATRETGHPEAPQIAKHLHEQTPEDTTARDRLDRYLPITAGA